MEIQYSEMDNGIRQINLTGRLDFIGTGEIETTTVQGTTSACWWTYPKWISSPLLEFRLLMLTAKSIASPGGRMVILNPTPDVLSVLEVTGIPSIIPVYSNLESAETILMA